MKRLDRPFRGLSLLLLLAGLVGVATNYISDENNNNQGDGNWASSPTFVDGVRGYLSTMQGVPGEYAWNPTELCVNGLTSRGGALAKPHRHQVEASH